jgi:hypothetical protein
MSGINSNPALWLAIRAALFDVPPEIDELIVRRMPWGAGVIEVTVSIGEHHAREEFAASLAKYDVEDLNRVVRGRVEWLWELVKRQAAQPSERA